MKADYEREICPSCGENWFIATTISNFPRIPAHVCSACGEIRTDRPARMTALANPEPRNTEK